MGRATATVLFTDLVGSTELRGRMGEEAADALRRTHDQLLTQAVEAINGRVVKGLGDGIMAAFAGASDAVVAAVAIQQAIDRLNRSGKTSVPLEVRIGLSAGDVSFEDDDVHGTPVIEASRLCGAAVGGEILASEIVRWLGGAQGAPLFVPVGSLELKGLAAPVPTLRIEWEPARASATPMPALLTDVGRIFVGRDPELERLGQLWKEAAAGERRVALLAGEPGVGKTRLAAEVAQRVHEQGGVVLAGRCDEDLGVPYQPFVEALRHFADHTTPENLRERLGRYGGELTRLIPELAQWVPDLRVPLQSDPETERYRLFDAVAAWLGALTAEEPVLVVLDDLQWAAKPTLLLLRHVLRSPEPLRLLVVVTYRDTDIGRAHPLTDFLADLRRAGGVERLSLGGLDRDGVGAFIEAAAGHDLADEEGVAFVRAVWEETEGNPFFVAEVIRHLSETGRIERRDGRWVATVPVEELGIPEGVRDVVGRRLSRLSEAANRALAVAAVVGLEFDATLVWAAGDVDEDDLLSALDEAVSARLVSEVSAGVPRYRFGHALVRATLYEELTGARRVVLHRKVAEAIEVVHAGALDDYLPPLAHHWAQAAAPAAEAAKAIEYATRAGDRALAQLAHDEAVSYYRQALELLEAHEGGHGGDLRVDLLISLGEAQRRAGGAEYRETLLDAARAARQRSDDEAFVRAVLANSRGMLMSAVGQVDFERVETLEAALQTVGSGDSSNRARLLALQALELCYASDWERRVKLSDEALQLARRLGDLPALAHVLMSRYITIWAPLNLDQRREETAELLRVAEQVGDPAMVARAWNLRYRAAFESMDIEAAQEALNVHDQLGAELGQPIIYWLSPLYQAGFAALEGRYHDAVRYAHQALELGQASAQPEAFGGFAVAQYQIHFELGRLREVEKTFCQAAAQYPGLAAFDALSALLRAELDDADGASRLLQRATPGLTQLQFEYSYLFALATYAAVAAHVRDVDAAGVLYELLSAYPNQLPFVAGTSPGSLAHYQGLLAATLGRFSEAEAHFGTAATAHERIGAPAWLARTRLEWASMLLTRRQTSDIQRARRLLGQALAAARELGLANVERRAVGLLEECP